VARLASARFRLNGWNPAIGYADFDQLALSANHTMVLALGTEHACGYQLLGRWANFPTWAHCLSCCRIAISAAQAEISAIVGLRLKLVLRTNTQANYLGLKAGDLGIF
jgi:hypothetical protein